MSIQGNPYIINDSSLVLYIDAANVKSNNNVGGTSMLNLAGVGGSPTLVNNVTTNNNLVLDGIDDYISITNSITSAALSPSIATFSIWFNPSSTGPQGKTCSLISRGNYNTAGGFFIHMAYNTLANNDPIVYATFSYSTVSSYTYNSTSGYSLGGFNRWHNVTVIADSNLSLYINGVLKQTIARGISRIVYGNDAINTGGDTNLMLCSTLSYVPVYSDSSWDQYKGSFGSMLMWNRRLSSDEVLQNYNTQKSRFGL